MAGIEKICEFSGEYEGWDMYRCKRNHIQILPQFRKRFRSAKARLVVSEVEPQLTYKMRGGGSSYQSIQPWELEGWTDNKTGLPVIMTPHEFLAIKHEQGYRLKLLYTYTLIVEDPALAGKVEGKYLNWSFDLSAVRRRLNRLLGYKIPVEWTCERPSFKSRQTSWAIPKKKKE